MDKEEAIAIRKQSQEERIQGLLGSLHERQHIPRADETAGFGSGRVTHRLERVDDDLYHLFLAGNAMNISCKNYIARRLHPPIICLL